MPEERRGLGPRQVLAADVAARRLIHGVVAKHVIQTPQAPRHLLHGGDVVPLQDLLRALAVDARARREGIAAEEQGEHGGCRQLGGVGWPDQVRRGVAVDGMQEGRARGVQVAQVKSNGFQRPCRGPVAAAEATPDVLMRIDQHEEAVLACLADNRFQVVEILGVVAPRAGVLNRLPGDEQAQEVEPPAAQTTEVLVGLLQGKWPADEGHAARIGEALAAMRRSVGRARHFAAAREVDAA